MELVVLRQWEDQVRYQRLSHIKIFKIKQITINKDTKTNLNLTHTHKLLQTKEDVQYTRYIHSAGGSQIKVENFCRRIQPSFETPALFRGPSWP